MVVDVRLMLGGALTLWATPLAAWEEGGCIAAAAVADGARREAGSIGGGPD